MGENRIQWAQHAFSLFFAVIATCYALWNFAMLPVELNFQPIFNTRASLSVSTIPVVVVCLTVTWISQVFCIFQTRRWVSQEVKKKFNFCYVGLTSVVMGASIMICAAIYDAENVGCYTLLLSDIFFAALTPALISERNRLFIPREISDKDDFKLPDDPSNSYIEQNWRAEWVFLLKCLTFLPFITLWAMHAMPWFMWLPGLLPLVLLSRIIPPDATEWKIDRHLIRYMHKTGDKVIAKRDWDMKSINFVEVLNFDPQVDFDDDEPKSGISQVFEGVQGYFSENCRSGVVIGTTTGEFYLLGLIRPNYAAVMIKKFMGNR